MSRILKTLGATITKTGERTITALVSTPGRDRDDDVIQPLGIQLEAFKRNSVIPWSHRYDQPPVGRATSVRATAAGLLMDVEFTPPELNEAGARIGQMYKQGYLNAFSIGFIPLEWNQNEWGGRTYSKVELLEVSAVAVPANAEALVVARAFGGADDDFYVELADDPADPWYLEIDGDPAELLARVRRDRGDDLVELPIGWERIVTQAIDEGLSRAFTRLTGRLD